MKTPRLSRWFLVAAILATCAADLGAQQDAADAIDAKLTKAEREKIADIGAQTQREVRLAQAELGVLKALLNRLLLSPDADMKEAERLLRQGLEWELKIRLAGIRREAEIRKLVGDRRWADLQEARKRQAQRVRENITDRLEPRIDRLVEQILGLRAGRLAPEAIRQRLKLMLRQLLDGAAQEYRTPPPAP